ncbi:site-specific integrase [uncultured Rhodoblastus sp.]|uniref:tyrosine-type recombinase/integrase n=1 Tax=uncultured Rhodoblastus sp. TaxID=543037 RepID=UPI0025CD256F|nr:site-specific integrase [uncultured Rhodoblastus sp.]
MRIYEHGSDWWCDFSYKGVRDRATTGILIGGPATKAAAAKVGKQKLLDAQIRWQQTGGKAPSSVPTMAEAIVRYHQSKGSQIGNAKNAKDNLKYLMWCRDAIGPDTPITEITDEVIQNLINKRSRDTVRGTGKAISAATNNRSVRVPMRQMMNWMALKAKIQGMQIIDWADLELEEAGPRERVLTYDELDSIRAAVVAENDGHLDAFEFALLCGFRLSNFTQLRWDEVFFESAQGYPNGRIAVIQKGGKTHTIPMTIGIRELLEKLKGNDTEAVFTFVAKKTWTNPKNHQDCDRGQRYPVTYYGWGSWFKDLIKRATLKDGSRLTNVRTHDLRKTCGSEILNATGNIVAAQKLLGHATVEQTARAYAFLSTDVLLNAMELVEAQKKSRHKSGTN